MKSSPPLQNASSRAYKAIKEMLARFELVPGQKITYDQLAAKLKMSKTPIINALMRLEQEEFFISFPNKGFFIKEMALDEFENVHRIREALEMLAVEEFITHGNKKGLKEIEQAMIAHRSFPSDGFLSRRRYSLDAAFHLKIAENGGNQNLYRLIKQIWEQLYLRHRIEGFPPKRYQETSKEHQEIFDAIKEGDLKKSQSILRNHLKKCKEAALLVIQQNKESYNF